MASDQSNPDSCIGVGDDDQESLTTPFEGGEHPDSEFDIGGNASTSLVTSNNNKRPHPGSSRAKEKKSNKKHKFVKAGSDDGDAMVVERALSSSRKSSSSSSSVNLHLQSVVKLFVKKVYPSQVGPWKMSPESSSTGTGFIIESNRLLTNAHVVYQAQSILCRPQLGSRKFECEIESISLPLDLAVLTVKDANFFKDKRALGLVPTGFENLPHLDDNVTAVGFPAGGDQVSVTRGVVSRITHNTSKVLWVQIDAAINPGNSGGPVFNRDGKVAGVACAGLRGANNIGYIIPSMIVKLFFDSTRDAGSKCNAGMQTKDNPEGFCGVASIGIGKIQKLENTTLREHLGMKEREGGVRVRAVDQVGACWDETTGSFLVRPHDVLLSINGIPIGEDGTVQIPGRPEERIPFETIVASQLPSTPVKVSLLRNKKVVDCTIIPKPRRFLCPQIEGFDARSPSHYLICGGFVFMVLTRPLAKAWEKSRVAASRLGKLQASYLRKPLTEEDRQIVVLSSVLANSINNGYHDLSGLVLRAFNGVDVFSLQHLATLVQESKEPLLEFRLGTPNLTNNNNVDNKGKTAAVDSSHKGTNGVVKDEEMKDRYENGVGNNNHNQEDQIMEEDEILAIMDRAACIKADPIIRKAHLIASPCSSGIEFRWPCLDNDTPKSEQEEKSSEQK